MKASYAIVSTERLSTMTDRRRYHSSQSFVTEAMSVRQGAGADVHPNALALSTLRPILSARTKRLFALAGRGRPG